MQVASQKWGLREIVIRANTYRALCAGASHRLTDLILINTVRQGLLLALFYRR